MEWQVMEEGAGERLDRAVADYLDSFSRSRIQKAIKEGDIQLNGGEARPSVVLKEGDRIHVDLESFRLPPILPEGGELEILYEDDDLLAVNKPAGMVVHPTSSIRSATLVNLLLGRGIPLSRLGGDERPGIVHRLDAQTSGLVLVAKTDAAYRGLKEQFQSRRLYKEYLAILEGEVQLDRERVDLPIGHDPRGGVKMAVLPGGKPAVSLFTSLQAGEEASLVSVQLLTGRTHQIRVHARELGHPVVGDNLYGYRHQRHKTQHQLLHAWRIGLQQPVSGKPLRIQAAPDQEFLRMLALYGFDASWAGYFTQAQEEWDFPPSP